MESGCNCSESAQLKLTIVLYTISCCITPAISFITPAISCIIPAMSYITPAISCITPARILIGSHLRFLENRGLDDVTSVTLGSRPVPIVLVKCWKVAHWNIENLLKNWLKSEKLLPEFQQLPPTYLDIFHINVNQKPYFSFIAIMNWT